MHRYSVKPFELLYYMAFGLYLFIQLLSSSLVSALIDIRILRVSGFFIIAGLIFAKLMIDNTFRHLWIYLSLIVLLTIVGLHAANIRDLIILGMLTFGARNIKLEKIVLEDVIMIGIFLVIMPFLFATGLFRNVDTSTFRGVSGRMRLSLGYGWTTYSANYYLAMVTGILFLAGRRRRMGLPLMLMFLGNIVLFMLTDTKAAFFETTILLVIYSLITACKLDLT